MIFDTDYYHALDHGYKTEATDERPLAEISIKDIGISAPPMSDQLQGLKSKIFQGASRVELGFTGSGKGSMQGQRTTPEMYGEEDREAMRDLAKINEIKLSTHASYSIPPLSGLDMRQGEFSDEQRQMALHEIQRAIDFAADTARGGAVVVHTGEFPRAITDYYKEQGFVGYPEEEEHAIKYLVDQRSGRFVSSIRKDQDLFEPVYITAKDKGVVGQQDPDTGHVFEANDWVDMDNKWINPTDTERLFDRVPVWNAEKTNFEVRGVKWKDFEKRAEDWNKKHSDETRTPEEMWVRTQVENQILQSKGHSLFYARNYEDSKKLRDAAKEALNFYEKLEDTIPEEEKWKIMKQRGYGQGLGDLIPPENKLPSEWLKEVLKDQENNMRHIHEASSAADAQAQTQIELLNNIRTVEDYGVKKAAETIARAAEFAYQKTKWLEQKGQLKEPIFVAPENIDPKMFGAHPNELKQLILNARDSFVENNKQRFGESQARELAEKHIKATFDIGHAFTWRKYFVGDSKKSIEQNDKDFKVWLIDQVKDLNKKGIIGHVHVSDNLGWEDEHITPGFGRAPIKEFIDAMAKAGIKDVIVEPAHQDYKALLGGWRTFGAPVYGAPPPATKWSDIEYSYFGQTRRPYFIFGDYAPSQDFTLWTQMPLE